VGKATLYRRYRSKQELAKAAVVHLNDGFEVPEDTGSLTGDFAALVRTVLALAEGTGALDVMPRLLSDVAGDEEMHELFTEHLVEPRRRVVRTLIERAIERGEVRRDIDPELAVDMIAGPMIYRVITSGGKIERLGNPLDVLHAALEGLRPR
ncbi:MAG TPA: TetR-like C-terminal domain-containing protein, partial [Solirubrobacter sp.]|nr:TetR-like C-terminal domain-containing protein [Solirubrobacter sp.]